MTAPANHNPPEGLEEELSNVPLDRGLRRAAFDLCRVLKVYYTDPTAALRATVDAVEEIAEGEGWDGEELAEEIYFSWPRVKSAACSDPAREAFLWAKAQPENKLPGTWPPLKKFRRDAATVFLMCRHLSGEDSKPFYLPCRKVGGLLGCSHERAASLIRELVNNGYLVIHKQATRTRAAHYRVGRQ